MKNRQMWPLLLPGIADKINKSYNFTIDDIPFKVYRNRDCNTIGFSVVPEDSILKSSYVDAEQSDDEESATSSVNGDESSFGTGEVDSFQKQVLDCSSSFDVSSVKTIPATEKMQSCLGSSMSKTLLVDCSNDYSRDLLY